MRPFRAVRYISYFILLLCATCYAQVDCFNIAAPTLTPASSHFPASGGATTVAVTLQGDCNWHPATNIGFIHLLSFTGLGGGFMQFSVDPNLDLAPRGSPSAIAIFSDAHTGVEGVTQDAATGDFSLRLSPGNQTVAPGASIVINLTITRIDGFNGGVNLSSSTTIPGVQPVLSSVTCCSATFTLNTSTSTPGGNYGLTVFGQNGNVTHSVTALITIQPPDFGVSVTPQFQTIVQGSQASYNVQINRTSTLTGAVSLSAPDFPGATISFNPQSTTGSSSTMTVTTTGSVSPGPSNINISGGGVINGQGAVRSTAATLNVNQPATALRFVPINPCRIADTRNPAGPFGGPFLSGGSARQFPILSSSCGLPSDALAYSLNVTVVPHGSLGFLTMYPCGQNQPFTSNLNSPDGRTKAVAAIVSAGSNGSVCAVTGADPGNDTDLILDINGYFASAATHPSALAFYPVAPCRIADTRNATGPFGGPSLTGGVSRTIPIRQSTCSLPSTAVAYSLNYTAVPKGPLGFLSTWPAGQPQPLVSTLNAPTGVVIANAAIVTAGTNGDISVLGSNDTDLVVDVNGYFAPPGSGGLSLYTVSPCRVLDTRLFGGNPFTGELDVNIDGSVCGIPSTAQSYLLSATVVPPGVFGFLTLWPQGTAQPPTSTLNGVDGTVNSNMAIVGTQNGFVSTFASSPTHLVLDISGYLAP